MSMINKCIDGDTVETRAVCWWLKRSSFVKTILMKKYKIKGIPTTIEEDDIVHIYMQENTDNVQLRTAQEEIDLLRAGKQELLEQLILLNSVIVRGNKGSIDRVRKQTQSIIEKYK